MAIQLTQEEEQLRSQIVTDVRDVKTALGESRPRDEVLALIKEMGERAHKLHNLLKVRGEEPRHHEHMKKNRALAPDHPDFYMHVHPVEDLIAFLEDPHANDDPKDQTIGEQFAFRVYSRRWGHDDVYHVKRTADGWAVDHIGIGGPCDKNGRPFLFENLIHDSIEYPNSLGERFESLWYKAASDGMTKEQVQSALDALAAWVTTIEKSAPTGGIWG